MKIALTLLVVAFFVLHQDWWNWTDKTLVFGFLPIGLAYHGFYALLCTAMMAVLVRFLWPRELDEPDGGEVRP